MAEVKNDFLKSKMNKDLDDRLVPKGEYRHAQNISIAKSEGNDVGALENILGNNLVADFLTGVGSDEIHGVEIIGQFMDVKNDRIIVFMTNYSDTSGDSLSNFAPSTAYNAIGVYNINENTSAIAVTGRFLNFSKTHQIYGVNVINDLLFWTDNRNQPRKINLKNWQNPSYYTIEDTISVSKYYPHQTIDLITDEVTSITSSGGTGYPTTIPAAPQRLRNIATQITLPDTTGVGLTIDFDTNSLGNVVGSTVVVNNLGSGYYDGQQLTVAPGNLIITVSTSKVSTMQDVVSDTLPNKTTPNPYRQPYDNSTSINWSGNPEYLKDKFVRFSYRFKFDDGEYSLIAPFTQSCFIPKQDGYFIGDDDTKTFKSTEVEFMENKVNNITLLINSPTGDWNNIGQLMKISEVDILYKEAGQNTIKIVDTITSSEFDLIYSPTLPYVYKSTKPSKTLPDKEILRVHDQVPVRALAQEVIGNRIVYGNYIDKPTAPLSLNYSTDVVEKNVDTQIEYQNQNLKQNRTYQVGVILSDRYGRQSTVILSSLDDSRFANTIKGSSLFNKYKQSPFSDYSSGNLFGINSAGKQDVWDGDAVEMQFWDTISSTKSNITGEPGLYDAITNPLGWYSYKIVVKQTEQDYYNIYFPGILNGYADGEAMSTRATSDEPICHFVLHGDNINKVPRDLTLVGPTQTSFRTGRPSAQEDPSYYQFVDSGGLGFTIDPFSEEGEKLLKERDRARDLDSGSQITNASVKLSLRLNNVAPAAGLTNTWTTTSQAYPGTNLDIVSTIGTGSDLGLWDPAAISPFNTASVFYDYQDNPYIAKTNVSDPDNTGLTGPHPLSGKFNQYIRANGSFDGANYVAGSLNILCTIPDNPPGVSASVASNFKVNIDSIHTYNGVAGVPKSVSVAHVGGGWDPLMPAGQIGTSVSNNVKISGAGDGKAHFNLHWSKTPFEGKMVPSLAVYETEPLKSKLDIYWETSTSGLIDELNTAINTDNITTPVGFIGDYGPVDYSQDESMDIGTYVTGGVYPVDAGGGRLTSGPITSTLLDVIDASGTSRFTEFLLENDTGAVHSQDFRLKTNAYFMAGGQNNTKGNFTFDIDVKSPSDSYLSDGSFINTRLLLGPYSLDNKPPIFNSQAFYSTAGSFIANTPSPSTFNIPFTNTDFPIATPPYTSNEIIHTNNVVDPQLVHNKVIGEYICNETGTYNISCTTNISALFTPNLVAPTSTTVTANSTGFTRVSRVTSAIMGRLFFRKTDGISGAITTMGIPVNVNIYPNKQPPPSTIGWGDQVWIAPNGGSYQTGGGINGYDYLNNIIPKPPHYTPTSLTATHLEIQPHTARTDGEKFVITSSGSFINVNDKIEVILEAMWAIDQFGYSVQINASIGIAPFYAVNGFYPNENTYSGLNAVYGTASLTTTSSIFAASPYSFASTAANSPGTFTQNIHTFSTENGSCIVSANSLKTDELTHSLLNDYNGLFYLVPSTTLGEVHLRKNQGGNVGEAFDITLRVTDGDNAAVDNRFAIVLK